MSEVTAQPSRLQRPATEADRLSVGRQLLQQSIRRHAMRSGMPDAEMDLLLSSTPEGVFPTRKYAKFEVELTSDDLKEIGGSGVLRDLDGLPLADPNEELHPIKARGLWDDHGQYHEMKRTDPIISGVMSLLIREIKRARYKLKDPPADATPLELEAHALVSRYFGFDGTKGWLKGGLRKLLFHGCLSLIYGFSPHEIVWSVKRWRGRVVLVPSKIHWRAPWSIERLIWRGDDLLGLQQLIQDDASRDIARTDISWTPSGVGGTWRRVFIPASRLLLFSHDATHGNPEGESVLRSAYRYWQLKQNTLRRIEASETSLLNGVTILEEQELDNGRPHPAVSEKDPELFADMLEKLYEGLLSHLVEIRGWKIRRDYPKIELEDRTNYLVWINHQILMTMTAPLFGLSTSQAASAALSDGLGQVFYNAADDHATDHLDVINGLPEEPTTGLVMKLCEANLELPDDFRYPEVEAEGIEHQDLKAFADFSTKLVQFTAITMTARDEQFVRRQAGFPDLTLEEIEAAREKQAATRLSEAGTQAPQAGPSAGDMSSNVTSLAARFARLEAKLDRYLEMLEAA